MWDCNYCTDPAKGRDIDGELTCGICMPVTAPLPRGGRGPGARNARLADGREARCRDCDAGAPYVEIDGAKYFCQNCARPGFVGRLRVMEAANG